MLCRTPPRSAWKIDHFRTRAASAWKCARPTPLARAGPAPAATPSRTTKSCRPYAVTGPDVSCKAATTRRRKFCSNLWAARASALAEKGDTQGLRPRTLNHPQTRWDFHCNLCTGPGHVLADVSFIHPLAAPYTGYAARSPAHAAALRDADECRDYFANHNCPGQAFRKRSLLKLWGGSVPGKGNSSVKPPTPLSPNWSTSVPSASPMCTTSCPWFSAVTCLACLPLQR
jgi:hypothetical protein